MLTCLISGRGRSNPPPRPRVLVVDDDPPTRRAMDQLLRSWGLETRSVGTVSAALAGMDWDPGCVVLDLMLPDGSGVEVLEHIRSNSLPAKVVVATGTSDTALIAAATLLRPDLFLPKPVDVDALAEFLAKC